MKRRLFSALFRNGYTQKTYLFVLEGDTVPDDDDLEVAEMLDLADFDPRKHDLFIAPVTNYDNGDLIMSRILFDHIPKLC
jgi:hypothetical protein